MMLQRIKRHLHHSVDNTTNNRWERDLGWIPGSIPQARIVRSRESIFARTQFRLSNAAEAPILWQIGPQSFDAIHIGCKGVAHLAELSTSSVARGRFCETRSSSTKTIGISAPNSLASWSEGSPLKSGVRGALM